MDTNTYLMIGVAVLSMFFGYFFGLFEGRGQGYKKRVKEEAEGIDTEPAVGEPDSQSEEPESLAEPLPIAQPEPPGPPPPPSLLRLSEDPGGTLQLELNDEPVDTNAIIPEQRKLLIALLTAMRPWLEGPQQASPASVSKPVVAPVQPAATRPDPTPAPRSEHPTTPPTGESVAIDEVSDAPQSIVGQIDAILQLRIADTALQSRGIKLQESPEGGVLVWVGLDKFESIDEVPYEDIKAAIRAAIVEWEDKFTPGIK